MILISSGIVDHLRMGKPASQAGQLSLAISVGTGDGVGKKQVLDKSRSCDQDCSHTDLVG